MTAKRPAKRTLALVQAEPWAITREALAQIVEIAARENRSVEAIEVERGQPLENTYRATMREGVATIRLTGPLFRYANLFTAISGATSLELVAKDLTAALKDPSIRGILLAVDSPGGAVSGTSELGDLIYEARGVKPIVAHVDGFGASAAYWLASAADRVTASDTSLVGSIGVIMAEYLDDDENVIEFVSSQSPRKRTNPTEDIGRAQRQAIVDALGERFLETVARHRGVSVDTVREDFGQGDVFVGAAAVEAGLIDGISTYEQVHAALVEETRAFRTLARPVYGASASRENPAPTGRVAATPKESTMKTNEPATLTAEQLAEKHPEQVAAIRAEGEAAGKETGLKEGRIEGATAERTRILAIEDLAIAGHEAVIAEAKRDPAATPEATAVKLLQAQKANPAPAAKEPSAADKHLAKMAGDEAKTPAPSAQLPRAEAEVQNAVAGIVQFSTLRRAQGAAAN